MSFDITEAIKSVGEAFKSLFDYVDTAKTRQSETAIIKENKRLKKAADATEKMLCIFSKYIYNFTDDDKKELKKLLDTFWENN